jgi:hypothetical protein
MRGGGRATGSTGGTRFRVFPQPPFADPSALPEIIEVSSPAGSIGPGPADERMYFVQPLGKRYPYGLNIGPLGTPWVFLPPWTGASGPPVEPGPEGHFDHFEAGTPEFEAAHLFGVTRFVMDVWERYLGHPIRWHFQRDFDRLELSILPGWDNAQMGYGYLEAGTIRRKDGKVLPFALNFDVIAHELGHAIIYSEVGMPRLDAESGEYFGFHEAAADWVALISALHFPSVVKRLLETTSGNLYTFNEFNRFSEFSKNEQIRVASNYLKLSDFARGWDDEHELAKPLIGALFDLFVDIFHETLVEIGAIDRGLEDLSDITLNRPEYEPEMQAEFDRAYQSDPRSFVFALEETRDLLGEMLVLAWKSLAPDNLGYADFGDQLAAADRLLTQGRLRGIIFNNFLWRDIGLVRAGLRVRPPGRSSHSFSGRSATPEHQLEFPNMSYRERSALTRSIPLLRR